MLSPYPPVVFMDYLNPTTVGAPGLAARALLRPVSKRRVRDGDRPVMVELTSPPEMAPHLEMESPQEMSSEPQGSELGRDSAMSAGVPPSYRT
jgi:hypothetical protein